MKWAEARALGLQKYNTGKPCKRGHVADRYTASSHCVECRLGDAEELRQTDARKQWKAAYEGTDRAKKLARGRKNRCLAKPGKAEAYRETKKRWQARNRAKARLYQVERYDRVRQATPPWVDRADILVIYEEAERISSETGVPHEVDHFYPLVGKNSCGLHVPWNLRVITANENRLKNNKSPEEFYAGAV